ncbi:MAG: cyclic nucleotide-binding domain-containing protein [Gammaproteobacteria bacterium]|nr:cyclic nucleotide-binding domain-containing protein [Gammaproteobacteria bacterium]MCP5199435.1 cyclic nucleotide-binding domain-containing protein [Gammaproteobacteria bacterium]
MTDDNDLLATRASFLSPLNKLSADRQARLLAQSEVLALRKKERVFEQGDRDDYTFYLLEGDLELYADGSLIKRVTGGDGASFQPLAQLQPRQMSAIAKGRCQVLRIRRSLLEQLLSMADAPAPAAEPALEVTEMEATQSGDWLMTVLQSELFQRIPPSNIQGLLDTLETVEMPAGSEVVRQGGPGDYYFIVQEGTCEVVRQGTQKREVRLAQLGPGDAFGEEALVSGGTRNATVRMLTDGALARLTKDDFTRLIKAPLLDAVDRAGGAQRVAAGARWLDVRFEDEHAHNGLPDSINIPLGVLRTRADELDPNTPYVVYCDTGGRSSAAAFLLAERGFDACYVSGGAVAEDIAPPATPVAPPNAAPEAPGPDARDDELMAARARASSLEAELEKAHLTVEQARRMMQEAEAAKAEAERVVEARLAAERDRLATERSRLDAEAAQLRERLADAEQLRTTLAREKERAEADASRRQEALEQRLLEVERLAGERLDQERARLEAFYQRQAEQLEAVQADRESELRERLERELAQERQKFTQEFLRANEELERAREERRAALTAKESATAEARDVVARFKAQQQQLLAEHRAAFEEERKRLQQQAHQLAAQLEEARTARRDAEAAREASERQLAAARDAAATAGNAPGDLEVIEQRASAAELELRQAIDAESVAAAAARENEDALERTYGTANEINILLQKELEEWVDEQNRMQESTLQREILSRQKEMVERIRQRANSARQESESKTQSLLDEIEQQLRGS